MNLHVDENKPIKLKVDNNLVNASIGTRIVIKHVGATPYTGDYTVIPKADEAQVLPTKDLLMLDDLTVTKVPYFETSNQYGETIYIASEV